MKYLLTLFMILTLIGGAGTLYQSFQVRDLHEEVEELDSQLSRSQRKLNESDYCWALADDGWDKSNEYSDLVVDAYNSGYFLTDTEYNMVNGVADEHDALVDRYNAQCTEEVKTWQ